jgi:hypothetical protein
MSLSKEQSVKYKMHAGKVFFSISFLLLSRCILAQNLSTQVVKEYVQQDSQGIHNSAMIVLFSGSTFLNFGIAN